jgi:hypothetical protein
MDKKEHEGLVEQLTESHSVTSKLLQGVNLEKIVYSDWRIREIIGHLATWDRQVTKSIRAFIQGTEYAIEDLKIDAFNEETTSKQKGLTSQQVYDDWEKARQDFIAAVEEVPPDLFQKDMLYPWGNERGNLSLLVEYMTYHDNEHTTEILKALKAQD